MRLAKATRGGHNAPVNTQPSAGKTQDDPSSGWDRRKVILSLLFGWAGLGLDLFPLDLDFSPNRVSFLFGHILPMLVALSWGGRYALIAAFPGLGGQFGWFVWPENGATNLVWAVVHSFWFVWHGYVAKRRARQHGADRSNLYAAEVIYSIGRIFAAVLIVPWVARFNPVFWAPDAASGMSDYLVHSIAAKQVINGFLVIFLCDLLLTQPTLRRFMGLRADEHEAAYRPMLSGSLLLGILIVAIDAAFDFYFKNPDRLTFSQFILISDDGEKTADQILYLVACMIVGLVAAEQLSRRLAAEAAARKSEERFRVLVEESPAPVLVVDANDSIQYANRAFEGMFGSPGVEVISIPRLIQVTVARVAGGESFARAWADMHARGGGSIEVEMTTAEGGRWIEWVARRINDRTLVMLHDLTDRRRLEEALKRTALGVSSHTGPGFLPALAGHAAAALGADWVCISALEEGTPLRARMLGCVLDGRPQDLGTYPLTGTPCAVPAAGGPCVHTTRVHEAFPEDDGLVQLRAEAYIGLPFHDSGGRVIGLINAIFRRPLADTELPISILRVFAMRTAAEIERMQSEARFRHAQKMEVVGRMAGSITHDFNNMLTPIAGYSDLLLRDPALSAPHREMVQQIQSASRRARDLTRRLLAFSRRQVMDMNPCDLGKVIAGFQPLLRQVLGSQVALTLRQSGTPCTVQCDPGQIEHALMNLAVNACDAMTGGGELTISVLAHEVDSHYAETHAGVPAGRVALVSVRDTGCGMSDEIKSHLFEPFFTTKERGRGTGLGLASVYGIVRQHGGGIVVESAPGEGTEFRIYLPLCGAEQEVPAAAEAAPGCPSGHGEALVLVEDDEQARELITRELVELGYVVRAFPGPAECLAYFAGTATPENLLVTDVVMPGGNGRELYERLHERHPNLRVLFVSGFAEDVLPDGRTLPEGSCFLQKPFTMPQLAARIREAISAGAKESSP